MDGLWEEFDDLDLQCDQPSHQPSDDKGKRPVEDGYSTDDECTNADSSHHAHRAPPSPCKSSEPGDMTCAICLGEIFLPEMAMVKGCAHIYCAKCIVAWALHRENPACPQCKQTFSYLLTYRTLDGELQDFPTEESVVLLKRARWLEKDLKACLDDDGSFLDDARHADDLAWHDYADDYDLDEDEAIEQFYFSSAAGRARVMIGNRRFGEGGFVSGGRRCARPAVKTKGKGSNKGGKGGSTSGAGSTSKAAVSERVGVGAGRSGDGYIGAGSSRSMDIQTPNAHGGRKGSVSSGIANAAATGDFGDTLLSSTPSRSSLPRSLPHFAGGSSFLAGESPVGGGGSAAILGSSPAGSGRRARRNARRAAFDAVASGSSSSVTVAAPEVEVEAS